jgi:hypothetical protein
VPGRIGPRRIGAPRIAIGGRRFAIALRRIAVLPRRAPRKRAIRARIIPLARPNFRPCHPAALSSWRIRSRVRRSDAR